MEEARKVFEGRDVLRKDKISIAPFRISKQDSEIWEEMDHFDEKKIVRDFSNPPSHDIHLEDIFQEARNHSLKTNTSGTKEENFTTKQPQSNLVFIAGAAGIGKSTLSKILLKEVIENDLFGIKYVFFVKFRDLDYHSNINLLQFLTSSFSSDPNCFEKNKKNILKHLESSEKVCIIMDGLDEAKLDQKLRYSTCNINSTTTAEIFIRNLFSGRLLPKAKKIVTSRPRQFSQLPYEYSSYLFLNLLGLSETGQEQICNDLCPTDQILKRFILSNLKSRQDFKSFCYVPINCIMFMMSFLTLTWEKGLRMFTMTSILFETLNHFFLEKLEGGFQTKEISFLAYNGFLDNQSFFKEFHLKKTKLNSESAATFLANNNRFKSKQGKLVSYFIHFMWQEFFVALKLRLYADVEEVSNRLSDLETAKYENVTKFLFGLCNESALDDFLDVIEITDLNSDNDREKIKLLLKNFALKKLSNFTADSKRNIVDCYLHPILPVLGWVYEMQDNDFTEKVAALLRDRLVVDNQIFAYVVPSIIYILQFRNTKLTLKVDKPQLGESTEYFFRELFELMKRNSNVQVSLKLTK